MSIISRIKIFFLNIIIRKWYLVSLTDDYVAYIGTFKQCNEAIDTLHGDFWSIMRYNHLSNNAIASIPVLFYHSERTKNA